MKNIVIIGASGHGSVVLDCIKQEGRYEVVGFIDSYLKTNQFYCGKKILGNEYDLPNLIEKFGISGGIIAIGDNWTRKKVYERIMQIVPDFIFISTVHPDSTIGTNVTIGQGSVVMPGAIVNANCQIGDFCILNTSCSLDHDSQIKQFSSLAPRSCAGGNLFLGSFSAIGLGTNIIENIKIYEHSVVGAGSLVINNIGSFSVAYGSPARTVRRRDPGEPYLGRNPKGAVISLIARN
ncbi:sugar O-acyltransferase (sialic acid O-acetyltransferase NeuD family) [Flavobacteriaceae bacterium MAR_2009_75]|nr:sugar O-acyltransferase (sialic acid O-acetyltransferase NeuD family) [Flavobacteriaceae bacterium MAR_2009_75]